MSTKLQQPENSEQLSFDFCSLDAARQKALTLLRAEPTDEHLWDAIVCYAGSVFYTSTGLPFTYQMK